MPNEKFHIVTGDEFKVRDPQVAYKAYGLTTYPYSIRMFYLTDEVGERKEVGLCARLIWIQDFIKTFKSIEDWKALIYSINSTILPSSIDEMFMLLDMERRLCYIWWSQADPT